MLLRWILMGGLFASLPCWPVSHIGPMTIGSDRSQFTAEIPPHLTLQGETEDESTFYVGGLVTSTNNQIPRKGRLALMEFAIQYPELTNMSREEIQNFFEGHSWSHSTSGCIDTYVKYQRGGLNHVMIWGSERGLVVAGDSIGILRESVAYIQESLELKEGACQWPN